MSHHIALRSLLVLVMGALAAGIATPQSFPADLQKYLNLTDAQAQSITDLNNQFLQYTAEQTQQYVKLSQLAQQELQKPAPDAGVAGDAYTQLEMLRRDNKAQLAQVQSKVAAVLTSDQVMRVNGLLEVKRLQPLVSEAQCVSLEPAAPAAVFQWFNAATFTVPTTAVRFGDFSLASGYCGVPPIPPALSNYLKLSDAQIASIENAIAGQRDYMSRQQLKVQQLQVEIADLTAAPTIDSAKLGADYVAMALITQDEAAHTDQLMKTARSVLNDSQQPALKALDNATQLSQTASQAVCENILVLPASMQSSSNPFGFASFLQVSAIFDPLGSLPPFGTNLCGSGTTGLVLRNPFLPQAYTRSE